MKNKPEYKDLEQKIKVLEIEKQFEHDQLMNLMESLPYGIYITDEQYNFQYINPVIEREFGPLKGLKCYEYLYNRTEACPWCKNKEVFAGKSIHWERYSSSNDKYYHIFDMPFKNLDGSISKFEILHDITNLINIQEELSKKMRDLDERVKELNCLYGISNIVDDADISLDEIIQRTVELIPLSLSHPEIACSRAVTGEKEFRTINFERTEWNQTSSIVVHGKSIGSLDVYYLEKRLGSDGDVFLKEEKALIYAVAKRLGKIIERKIAQEEVEKSEQRFRNLIENSPSGILIVQDNIIVYGNSAQKQITGVIDGSFLSLFFEHIHPDEMATVKTKFQKLIAGENQQVEMNFRFYPADQAGKRFNMKWVYCTASVFEYRGKDAILMNLMDITLTKKLESIVRTQDKMTSLGRVAAGIAHEIRNPLSGINIYLNTLDKIYSNHEDYEKVSKIISQIQSASNKIESVIKRVMDFSKPSEPKFTWINMNRPIKEALNLSSVTLRKSGIQISSDLSTDLPKCKADPQMMEQVILNLISNASEAMHTMHEDKKIHISSSLDNESICIRVLDSGPGVSQDILNNILDPFYTTKSDSSGIGLSICHRIITDHGGSIDISTADLGGAEFTIHVPVHGKTGKK